MSSLVPDSNATLVLALLVMAGQYIQAWRNKKGAKAARVEQTAVLQGATDQQTELIMGSINGLRSDVGRVAEAQERMEGATRIELADHSTRLREYGKRLDGHDVHLHDHQVQLVDLHERVQQVEKDRK